MGIPLVRIQKIHRYQQYRLYQIDNLAVKENLGIQSHVPPRLKDSRLSDPNYVTSIVSSTHDCVALLPGITPEPVGTTGCRRISCCLHAWGINVIVGLKTVHLSYMEDGVSRVDSYALKKILFRYKNQSVNHLVINVLNDRIIG